MFEKNKVYDFVFSRVVCYNGEPYFVLSYNGSETMPGYEDVEWFFRVKVLPFQESWEPSELKNRIIPCKVQRFNVDRFGYQTTFPILSQDVGSILRSKYQAGQSYDFTVASLPGEPDYKGEPLPAYQVADEFGFRHFLNAEPGTYRKGESLSLRVREVEGNHVLFENQQERRPSLLHEGETYDFEICSESQTRDGRVYFIVKDAVEGLLHRYYPQGEIEESVGDKLSLRVKGFTTKGWLVLEDPTATVGPAEFLRIARLEDEGTLGQEGPMLEYKSSFVYTRNGELDIDSQLGYEIMRHVAGFMNADGGLLCIGYYDDGSIRGINDDLPYINTSNEDDFQYDLTEDKITLKFVHTIANSLGSLASSRVKIELRQNSAGRIVCFLQVSPAKRPVWYKGKELFIRCFNSVRKLRGPEITDYICERCGVKLPAEEPTPAPAPVVALPDTAEPTQPVATGSQLLVEPPPARDEEAAVWRYISLYADGTVSQQKAPSTGEDVLFNIPVSTAHKKKTSRLLLCYSNGCVNVLNPKEVIDNKLTKPGKRYANGFNVAEGVSLLAAFVGSAEDYLVIRSRKESGREMLKAVCIAPYKVHNPQSMQTKGNIFVKEELARVSSLRLVAAEHTSFIYRIISRTADKYGPGHPIDSPLCADAVAYLERG